MSEFHVTPSQIAAWNAEALASVPGASWRTQIDAAGILIVRIALSGQEDPAYVLEAVPGMFQVAFESPQPEYAKGLRGVLHEKSQVVSVKTLLDAWWKIIDREFNVRQHQMALGTMLGIELAASLTRDRFQGRAIRDLLGMTMLEFFNSQLTHDRKPLAEVAGVMSAAALSGKPSHPQTDLSPQAFAAITVLARLIHMDGTPNYPQALHTLSAIEARARHYHGQGFYGCLNDYVDTTEVNDILTQWREQLNSHPLVDHGTMLSALAIDVLARILPRLVEAEKDLLLGQIAVYVTSGPTALDSGISASENDNAASH